MAEPISINSNLNEIQAAIRESLKATGRAHGRVQDIRISLAEWRKLARAAARELGRPVETVADESDAWAFLRDWPSNAEEEAKVDASLRAVANATAFNVPLK